MKLFTAIYDDARLLGPFLRHYDRYRITEFFIATSADYVPTVKDFMESYKITLIEGLDVADSFLGGSAAITEMRRLHQMTDEWVVIADLDEFIEFVPDIHHILSIAERDNANVVRGIMYDRFSADGTLLPIGPDSDLPRLFPVRSRFTRDVMCGADWKGVIVKGPISPAPLQGHHHFPGERLCSLEIEIAHYKWNDRAIERVKVAIDELQKAGRGWTDEYKRAITHFERFGRFAWETFGGELVG